MKYENRDKNPFFLPALIAALFFPAGILFGGFFGLDILMLVTPYVALILSIAGLVTAIIWQKRFIGFVFCLVLSIFGILFPVYLSRPICASPLTTRSPEESASIESVREEIDRALYGNTTTKTTKS